jgi:phosphate acetyltransferase
MSKGIYVTGIEPRSGKSLAVLGIMEQLSGRISRVGFFRPVIREDAGQDRLLDLIVRRYNLTFDREEMWGCTLQTARDLLSAGKEDELHGLILEKYKALEEKADFVLAAGTDYTSASSAFEFDFNIDVARNLGAPLVAVLNGSGRPTSVIVDGARLFREALHDKKCDVLALIINRVDEGLRAEVLARLKEIFGESPSTYVLPELPLLEKPTVGEVAGELGAELLSGDPEWLDSEVSAFRVAAMELPHFLDRVVDGCLVITPGDRSDIILGTIAADLSRSYPRIAGLVVSGGLRPAPQVQRLIDGLGVSPVPVLAVTTDTFTTAVNANAVKPFLTHENKRKISAALGIVESSIDIPELLQHAAVTGPGQVTPLMFQYELIRRAKGRRTHIVLPEGAEERVLRAAEIVLLRDICDVTLLGNVEEVRQKISALGLSLDKASVIDPVAPDLRAPFADSYFEARKHKGISRDMAYDTMADVSYFGTMMVHLGHADGMVSGAVHTTAHTIRPALEFVRTKPRVSIVSSVFFMCLADRVLVYGDCAINPEPTADQLADIAISSATTAQAFGVEPRIAMLSYSTGESGKGPEVDKVREATRIARERRPDLKIEGPIQYDAAIDATVAKVKMPESEVAGRATVFIFPDLNAGNNAYKAVQRAADAIAIGPVLQGLNKPVNDLSRGASVPDIVNTVAITAIQARSD